jgi:hypothetical protein
MRRPRRWVVGGMLLAWVSFPPIHFRYEWSNGSETTAVDLDIGSSCPREAPQPKPKRASVRPPFTHRKH